MPLLKHLDFGVQGDDVLLLFGVVPQRWYGRATDFL